MENISMEDLSYCNILPKENGKSPPTQEEAESNLMIMQRNPAYRKTNNGDSNNVKMEPNLSYGKIEDKQISFKTSCHTTINDSIPEEDSENRRLKSTKKMARKAGALKVKSSKKRLAYILLTTIVLVVIVAIVIAYVFLFIAYMRISELNFKLNMLQQGTDTTLQPTDLGGAFNPAASCAAVLALVPSSPSGYYWIRSSNGSAVRVYCDMTRSCGNITGGWMRVAELDMTNSSSQCPSGLRLRINSTIRTCGVISAEPSCSSIPLPTGVTYSKVCGRIRAYQYSSTGTFRYDGRPKNPDIDDNYVDGVSLTHGSLRQHIWTFAAALDEVGSFPGSNCPCTNINQATRPPPAFVGNDYFCDTGSQNMFQYETFYSDDPLWDGAGCGPDNTCCSFNNPPWFYKQLPAPTTDDIEMRVCRDEDRNNEDVAIEAYDIYVQS